MRPSFVMARTEVSRADMSVSASVGMLAYLGRESEDEEDGDRE